MAKIWKTTKKPYTGVGYPQNCPKCKCGVINIIDMGNDKGKLKCYGCGNIYPIDERGRKDEYFFNNKS